MNIESELQYTGGGNAEDGFIILSINNSIQGRDAQ
jgi:hypothetical protein